MISCFFFVFFLIHFCCCKIWKKIFLRPSPPPSPYLTSTLSPILPPPSPHLTATLSSSYLHQYGDGQCLSLYMLSIFLSRAGVHFLFRNNFLRDLLKFFAVFEIYIGKTWYQNISPPTLPSLIGNG